MLHILVLIAKIAGIIILAVLGLLLLILFTVLCVPVRYRGNGTYFDKPEGTLKITWLLHIISMKLSYRETFDFSVRLFGFRLFREKGEEALHAAEDAVGDAAENLAGDADRDAVRDATEDVAGDAADFAGESMVTAQELREPLTDPKETDGSGEENPRPEETEPKCQGEPQPEIQPELQEEPQAETDSERWENPRPDETEPQGETRDSGPAPVPRRKKRIFARMAERIRTFFKRLADAFRRFRAKLRQAGDLKDTVMTYISDEENKKTFRLVLKQGKKVILHILPRKIRGNITFGFDDPYRTGQVLTGAAFFYPLCHRQLSLQPVFDRKILEGDIAFKGRIRMGTLLIAGLKVLMNKNFRTQLKRFLNRGGI